MQVRWICFIKMHLGAFVTKMLRFLHRLALRILLFFCSSVQKIKTKKNKRYMKKTYVSPLAVEVAVEASQMLAASLNINSDKTVDTSNGGQLSGGHRGTWGNLWQ